MKQPAVRERVYLPKAARARMEAAPAGFRASLRIHLENVATAVQHRTFAQVAGQLPKDSSTGRLVWEHPEGTAFYSVDPSTGVVFLHSIKLKWPTSAMGVVPQARAADPE